MRHLRPFCNREKEMVQSEVNSETQVSVIYGVPNEKPFFIFGSFYDVALRKKHIFHKIREIYNKFSTPYVGIYIFNQPTLVIRSPELLKKVLVKDFDKFINRKVAANEAVDPISFHTLFSSKNDNWRNLRAKMSPVFTSGKIKLMFPLMKECGSDLVNYIKKHNGEVIEAREVTKKYAVDIIFSCAFGINSYCLKNDNSGILQIATQLVDFNSVKRNISIFCFFFMPKLVDIFRLTFADKQASDYLMNIFNTTMEERRKNAIVRNDLIDMLHNLKENSTDKSDYTFDDIKVAAQALSFFSAGNDTTSLTITFALYELALNTDIQDRLREDIRKHHDAHGDFTYEAIQDMKYLDMVLCETLRKYPLTNFLNRECETKYTFEESGLTIDKGTSILIPVAGLHYDEEYFPNPEKFDPERFSDENKSKIVAYTYLPFGDGPRVCIGQRFAMLVSKVSLAYILKDFAVKKTNSTTVPLQLDPGAIFLANKNGVHLKVDKV
ncbi:cytochrome P450 6k1-like [Tribolium madens]|uniref:cytochrome P450 6k1-like n=1 Tax=Tribolium madens TaxID=41895 RepID=UPI001CF72D0A|nr:cytochrome P450 6k1-like [Tribolium madens]XP_044261858.1 cytochrome P450 6k1-like [Tribolium madens]XP_044261868.1 cytochrome P450 6k1-like [Tribolium madens]